MVTCKIFKNFSYTSYKTLKYWQTFQSFVYETITAVLDIQHERLQVKYLIGREDIDFVDGPGIV